MIHTKVKEEEGCLRVVNVEVPTEEVAKIIDSTLLEMLKYASVPGFRAGKAPKDLVMAHYGDKVRDEALKRIVSNSYQEMIDSMKLVPVSAPEVYDLEFHEEKPLTYNVKVEIKPEIKLKDFSSIKIEKKKYAVQDSDVEERLNYLRETNAEFVSVEDRSVQDTDYVIADVECFIDGISKEKAQNIWLVAKENTKDEISKSLIGCARQVVTKVVKKLPNDYPKEDMRLKDAEFSITVKEIKKKNLAPLDNEFARLIGNFESLDALKAHLRKLLEAEYQRMQAVDMRTQIIDALDGAYDFSIPSSLIAREIERIKHELEHRLSESNVKKELLDEKMAKVEPSIKKDAQKNVKVHLILNEISDKYSIEASEAEADKRIEIMALSTKQDVVALRDHIMKNDLLDDIKLTIRQEKVFDFIISKAQIEEKEIDTKSKVEQDLDPLEVM
ncbi:MAG: trigger factor [Candidatus Omnitrophota bacterium]